MPRSVSPPPSRLPDGPQDGLLDALVQASFAVTAVLTTVGAEHHLSLTQLRVLAILQDRRARMTALASHLGLDRSTLTGLVDRAAVRGLLTREPGTDDGRVIEVRLTAAGVELATALRIEIRRSLAPLTAALSGPEAERLRALLERLLTPPPHEQGGSTVGGARRSRSRP